MNASALKPREISSPSRARQAASRSPPILRTASSRGGFMLVSISMTLSEETFHEMLEVSRLKRLSSRNKCELRRKTLSAGIAFVQAVIEKHEPTAKEILQDLDAIKRGLEQSLSVIGPAELREGASVLNRKFAISCYCRIGTHAVSLDGGEDVVS
jgi:hypothetical protein